MSANLVEWSYVECNGITPTGEKCCGLDHGGGYTRDPNGDPVFNPCKATCPHCGCAGRIVTMSIGAGSQGPILVRHQPIGTGTVSPSSATTSIPSSSTGAGGSHS